MLCVCVGDMMYVVFSVCISPGTELECVVEECAVFCYCKFGGKMPRDNRCVYMSHVCFYVCCSDCV